MTGKTLYDKLWDAHLVHEAEDGTSLLYIEPPSRPRSHQPAGLRGAAHDRPHRARARQDHRRSGPQRPHDAGPREPREHDRGQPHPGRRARHERQGFRHPLLSRQRRAAGDRAYRGPRTGLDPAGHDRGLRRQPHRDPRRIWRAGARDRHLRGGACAGHPDAHPEEVQEHEGGDHGATGARCHRQGHHAFRHRQDRHGGRHRLCHRVFAARRSGRCRWKAG